MDFHEIEGFIALARHLNYARAAEMVNVSPSALSRMVVRIEDEFGVRFFDRDTRTVQLTEKGRQFLLFAQESLALKSGLELSLHGNGGFISGPLRVFASVTACYSILPVFVSEIRLRHPSVQLFIETGDPADAIRMVRDNLVDCALASIPGGTYGDLAAYEVAASPLVFVGSETISAYRNQRDCLELISGGHPIIVPHHGIVRDKLDHWLKVKGIRPTISAEVSGNEAVLALARLGMGLGLVPLLVLENSPFAHGMKVFQVDYDLGEHRIGFFLRVETPLRKPISTIFEAVYPRGKWH